VIIFERGIMSFLRSTPVVAFAIAVLFFYIHINFLYYAVLFKFPTTLIPLTEEMFKFVTLAIHGYCGVFWTSMFGISEAIDFIEKYKHTDGFWHITTLRSIAFLFHFFLLGIQYLGFRVYRKTRDKNHLFYFFLTAVSLHYLWNLGGGVVFVNKCIKPLFELASISLLGR